MTHLDANGFTEEEFLKQYNPGDYHRPSVTADIVIFTAANIAEDNYRKLTGKELRILLIQRGGHPFFKQWALPGGFVHPNETVGEGANRELEEETGIKDGYLEQLYTFSSPKRDPRTWVISCAHMALINSERLTLCAGSDAEDAKWFSVKCVPVKNAVSLTLTNENTILTAVVQPKDDGSESGIIENSGLAFDHAQIIERAICRLRSKLEYTDLAFSLMPEKFTLTELQQVYEAILDKQLFKAAFRRKIANLVLETDQFIENKGHRPARLYIKNKRRGITL